MSSSFNDQVEQSLAELSRYQEQLAAARRDLEAATVSELSKNRLLTVVLGIDGGVRKVTFHNADYAAMAPAELSALVTDTIGAARKKAADKLREAMRPFGGFGDRTRGRLASDTPLEEALGALGGAAAGLTGAARIDRIIKRVATGPGTEDSDG